MSHVAPLNIDVDQMLEENPIEPVAREKLIGWVCVFIGVVASVVGLVSSDAQHFWGAYYTNVIFWMGLSVGTIITAVIFQIVRARWSPPVRRLGEANLSFLPWIYFLFLLTYFGKQHLFPWAREPMPGREWWMQPDFVYLRFAILLALLFFVIARFVSYSLRSDVGMIREQARNKERWRGWLYKTLTNEWEGTQSERMSLQKKMSVLAPIVIVVYAIIYTMFMTEMLMSMDTVWYANMFGGFNFVGNVYMGWVVLVLLSVYYSRRSEQFASAMGTQQYWDLGKLAFGFCMLWGYLFFSHYLPQWYGNLPEETQWLLLRTAQYPWKRWGWLTFSLCFVLPFILLLSRDLKRTPKAFSIVGLIILAGIWSEKYIVIMPQLSPGAIPFGLIEIGIFVGFLGVYFLSIQAFMRRFPFLPVSHPLTSGSTVW